MSAPVSAPNVGGNSNGGGTATAADVESSFNNLIAKSNYYTALGNNKKAEMKAAENLKG